MIEVSATAHVRCTSEQARDFVLDIDRYRQADSKIGRVQSREVVDGDVVVTFRTTLRGMPATTKQRLHVVGTERIEVAALPSWQDRLVRFRGLFEFRPTANGTEIRHAYTFDFAPAVRWAAEPYLRGWLAGNIADEVAEMKRLLERGYDSTGR